MRRVPTAGQTHAGRKNEFSRAAAGAKKKKKIDENLHILFCVQGKWETTEREFLTAPRAH